MSTDKVLDLVIAGAGPAGMAAGIYAGRGGLDALLLDMMGGGGQVNIIDRVENYPGVMDLETGADLAEVMRKQTESFGVGVKFEQIKKVEADGDLLAVTGAKTYRTKKLLVATGARHRPMKVPGEGKLMGRGVSVCATCDGPFFKGKHVAVVGGGDSAIMEAVYLSRIVERVTIIHRRDRLRAEKLLQDRIFAAGNVDFCWDTVVQEVVGDEAVTALKLKNLKSDEVSDLEVAAVFVFIGLVPNTEFLEGLVELDESGFIKTDSRMRTSRANVFAAGDVRSDSVRQIGVAVGEAITAAVTIQEELDSQTPPRKHLKSE